MLNKRVTLLFLFHFITVVSIASPAYPKKIQILTSSGKHNYIYLKGDENFKYAFSEDGYTLLCDSTIWKYATYDNDSTLVPSSYEYVCEDEESDQLKAFKLNCGKNILPKYKAVHRSHISSRVEPNNSKAVVGEKRALVVLMQYKDVSFSRRFEEFDELFNEIGYSKNNADGSVRDYYLFASRGKLDYVSDIYGPYTTQYKMDYYGRNNKAGGSDENAVMLCIEAIRNLPKNIDLSLYDNDKDGLVDNIHVIFAGYGEESGASSTAIWSHEYPHRISMKSEVGFNFAGYSCTPELKGNNGKELSNIGVICHELGHALGANDYYDVDYEENGSYEGTGEWDIMASGSWNNGGKTPPNFNPYVRIHDFGWDKSETLNNNMSINMPSYADSDPTIYRINTEKSGEYFLLENRQKSSFDAAIPATGLLIYHVHPDIQSMAYTNRINATHPQGLFPICSSEPDFLHGKYGNINSSSCPFPGINGVTSFVGVSWDGDTTNISLEGIKEKSDGTISFKVTGHQEENPNTDDDNDDIEETISTIYSESFEKSGNYVIEHGFGKIDWEIFPSTTYVTNADMIPKASDGNKIIMMFSGKGKTISESYIKSPDIIVQKDKNYKLFVDYLSFPVLNVDNPTLSISIYAGETLINKTIINEATSIWKTIEIPFVSPDSCISYVLDGNLYGGGLFVDNINVEGETPLNIHRLNNDKYKHPEIFDLNGMIIKELNNNSIYIKQGKKYLRNKR